MDERIEAFSLSPPQKNINKLEVLIHAINEVSKYHCQIIRHRIYFSPKESCTKK